MSCGLTLITWISIKGLLLDKVGLTLRLSLIKFIKIIDISFQLLMLVLLSNQRLSQMERKITSSNLQLGMMFTLEKFGLENQLSLTSLINKHRLTGQNNSKDLINLSTLTAFGTTWTKFQTLDVKQFVIQIQMFLIKVFNSNCFINLEELISMKRVSLLMLSIVMEQLSLKLIPRSDILKVSPLRNTLSRLVIKDLLSFQDQQF